MQTFCKLFVSVRHWIQYLNSNLKYPQVLLNETVETNFKTHVICITCGQLRNRQIESI